MFEIGADVVYGVSGVCHIADIRNETFSDEEKLFYVLNPLSDMGATIYVPVDNPKSVSKMKKILTKEEVYDLIHSMPDKEVFDEQNNKIRKDMFSQIIKNGDRNELIKLIKTVYAEKKEREKQGKKMWAYDETAMKKAEKILYEEIATVLDIKYEEVLPFIKREIDK